MNCYRLQDCDAEELGDWISLVEQSLDITMADNELAHVGTVGELAAHIRQRVRGKSLDDCTTQQAFYRLRTAFQAVLPAVTVTPQTPLSAFLPRRNRLQTVRAIESAMGFELDLLSPPDWAVLLLTGCLLGSIVGLFFEPLLALGTLALALISLTTLFQYGCQLQVQTVGELAKRVTKSQYSRVRRHAGTYNPAELEWLLMVTCCDTTGVEPRLLTRDSPFGVAGPGR